MSLAIPLAIIVGGFLLVFIIGLLILRHLERKERNTAMTTKETPLGLRWIKRDRAINYETSETVTVLQQEWLIEVYDPKESVFTPAGTRTEWRDVPFAEEGE